MKTLEQIKREVHSESENRVYTESEVNQIIHEYDKTIKRNVTWHKYTLKKDWPFLLFCVLFYWGLFITILFSIFYFKF